MGLIRAEHMAGLTFVWPEFRRLGACEFVAGIHSGAIVYTRIRANGIAKIHQCAPAPFVNAERMKRSIKQDRGHAQGIEIARQHGLAGTDELTIGRRK
jgi:hypothetical protein